MPRFFNLFFRLIFFMFICFYLYGPFQIFIFLLTLCSPAKCYYFILRSVCFITYVNCFICILIKHTSLFFIFADFFCGLISTTCNLIFPGFSVSWFSPRSPFSRKLKFAVFPSSSGYGKAIGCHRPRLGDPEALALLKHLTAKLTTAAGALGPEFAAKLLSSPLYFPRQLWLVN